MTVLIGLSLIVNHTHCTLSAEKKACCVVKVVGPYTFYVLVYTCIYYRHLINTSNIIKQWGKSVVFCSTWVWLVLITPLKSTVTSHRNRKSKIPAIKTLVFLLPTSLYKNYPPKPCQFPKSFDYIIYLFIYFFFFST